MEVDYERYNWNNNNGYKCGILPCNYIGFYMNDKTELTKKIRKRHEDLGKSTLHVDGLSKIWMNHYLNDISCLLGELAKRDALLDECEEHLKWFLENEERAGENLDHYEEVGLLTKIKDRNKP